MFFHMKRLMCILCAIMTFLIACAALHTISKLPADNKAHIEQKYAGWSGVLQAGVCSRWQPGGSLVRWLNRCAADFEKKHDGVYIEFIECEEMEIPGIFEIYTPDIFFFSPGVITDASAASSVQTVCMGGYALIYNRNMDNMNSLENIQPDTNASCYSAAAIALHGADIESEKLQIDTAMDIGLEASASDADIFSRFVSGEIPCIAASTKDISRLQKLSDAGKGPDWKAVCPGGIAFTDQLLYMMTPAALPSDGRNKVIEEFAAYLLTDKCQGYLSDIGAIPVCGERSYPSHSPYAVVEASLSGEIITPPVFSEYCASDSAAIVRSFQAGEMDKAQAIKTILENRRVKG